MSALGQIRTGRRPSTPGAGLLVGAVLAFVTAAALIVDPPKAVGDRLAVTTGPGMNEVFSVGVSGRGRRNLSRSTAQENWPTVSPDGRRVAFVRTLGSHLDALYVVNVNGRSLRRLTPKNLSADLDSLGGLAWSPEGRHIAFNFSRNGGAFLVDIIRLRDGALVQLARNAVQPAWSRDGRRIAYVAWPPPYTPGHPGVYRVIVARPDGHRLWTLEGTKFQWSPDGTRIAIWSDTPDPADERTTIFSAGARRLGSYAGMLRSWSPDSRRLALSRGDPLYVADAGGGTARRLADFAYDAAWSANSRKIAFSGEDAARLGTFVVAVNGGKPRRIAPSGYLAWAAAGDILVEHDRDLIVVRPDGSARRRIAHERHAILYAAWALHGRAVVYGTAL
jgi:Tol biopolymer transport system component